MGYFCIVMMAAIARAQLRASDALSQRLGASVSGYSINCLRWRSRSRAQAVNLASTSAAFPQISWKCRPARGPKSP